MRIQINSKRPLTNGSELKTMLDRISAEWITPDGVGAYSLPEEVKFGLTPDNKRVAYFDTTADTRIIMESFNA